MATVLPKEAKIGDTYLIGKSEITKVKPKGKIAVGQWVLVNLQDNTAKLKDERITAPPEYDHGIGVMVGYNPDDSSFIEVALWMRTYWTSANAMRKP